MAAMGRGASRWMLALGCLAGVAAGASEDFGEVVMRAWAREPACAAAQLVDSSGGSKCGAAMVLVTSDGENVEQKFFSAGSGGSGAPAPFNRNSMTEIASISKVFTAMLLQFLVDAGHVRYNTTLDDILNCETSDDSYATPAVKTITLFELATHTSGLPAQPINRHMGGDNPFMNYTQSDLCESLRKEELTRRGNFVYSNIGFGLLGYLLELRMGKSFEDLSAEWVLAPLGMPQTKITITDTEWLGGAVAPGLDATTGNGPVWRHSPYGVLQGNGAFHSTQTDFATFMEALLMAMQRTDLPLSAPLMRMLIAHAADDCLCLRDYCEDQEPCPSPNAWRGEVELAWQSFTHELFPGWRKAGDTEGYSSNVVFLPGRGRAVYGFDTCGGCGSGGEQGSAIQRAVQILAGGPLPPHVSPPELVRSELEEFVGIYRAKGVERTSLEVSLAQDGLLVQTRHGANVSDVVQAEVYVLPSRRMNEGQVRLSLDRSVGSDGGGPGDKSWLSQVQQSRELIFLKDLTKAALAPHIVVFSDGGQDTFFTRDGVGVVFV